MSILIQWRDHMNMHSFMLWKLNRLRFWGGQTMLPFTFVASNKLGLLECFQNWFYYIFVFYFITLFWIATMFKFQDFWWIDILFSAIFIKKFLTGMWIDVLYRNVNSVSIEFRLNLNYCWIMGWKMGYNVAFLCQKK